MAQGTNGADRLGRELKDTRHAACKRGGNKLRCEHGKMSVDFPNEAARCQRFSSGRAQSNFAPRGQTCRATQHRFPGRPKVIVDEWLNSEVGWESTRILLASIGEARLATKLCPCDLDQNTRSKDRVRRDNRSFRAVAQLGSAPGSGPGGRGFKSHQPDIRLTAVVAVAAATGRGFKSHQPDSLQL